MDILLSRSLEPSSYDAGSGPGFCNKLEVCNAIVAQPQRSLHDLK